MPPHTTQNGRYHKVDQWRVGEDGRKGGPLCVVGETADWGSPVEIRVEITLTIDTPYDSAVSLWVFKENENTDLKRYIHPHVHWKTVFNYQAKLGEKWREIVSHLKTPQQYLKFIASYLCIRNYQVPFWKIPVHYLVCF